jgi:hypothetical protein
MILHVGMFKKWWIDRFHTLYIRHESGCWIWPGGKDKDGYGKVSVRINGMRCHLRAHRAMAALRVGVVGDKSVVMHKCDNPSCVNPDHLTIGSHIENEHDKIAKNRHTHGASHPHALLDDNKVTEAIYRMADGDHTTNIAKDFGVTRSAIRHIVTEERTWRHVLKVIPRDILMQAKRSLIMVGSRCSYAKLSEPDVIEIHKAHGRGETCKTIAKRYGLHKVYVGKIIRGERWKRAMSSFLSEDRDAGH